MANIPYIIVSPGYKNYHGGIRALYRLCFLLKKRGYESYICNILFEPQNCPFEVEHINKNSTKYLEVMNKNPIVIYPEIVQENILSAIRPVGFIMGTNFAKKQIYNPSFYWEKELMPEGMNIKEHLLCLDIIEHDLFNTDNITKKRDIITVWVGKGHPDGLKLIPEKDYTLITNEYPATRQELANLLKSSKKFYTCDFYSSLIEEALLCGCPVVLLSNQRGFAELHKSMRPSLYGVTTDLSEESFKKAVDTLPSCLQIYKDKLVLPEEERILNFIKITQDM